MESDTAKQSLSLLADIQSVTAIVDLNDPGWEQCQQTIFDLTGSRIKTEIIFIDSQRKRKDNPWTTPGNQTFFKNDFNIFGKPRNERLLLSIRKDTDLLICLTPESDKKIEKLVTGNKSRIKIGRTDFPGHPYDLLICPPEGVELPEAEVMNAITSYLKSIRWK